MMFFFFLLNNTQLSFSSLLMVLKKSATPTSTCGLRRCMKNVPAVLYQPNSVPDYSLCRNIPLFPGLYLLIKGSIVSQ